MSLLSAISLIVALLIPLQSTISQVGVELRQVSTSQAGAELMLNVSVSDLEKVGTDRLGALVAGERLVRLPSGVIGVLRRFPLIVASSRPAVAVSVVEWKEVLLGASKLAPSKISQDIIPTRSLAEIVDVAPRGNEYSATLEVLVAQIDPSTRVARIALATRLSVLTGSLKHPESLLDPAQALHSASLPTPKGLSFGVSEFTVQGDWYRLEATETGIYKLDRAYFRNAGVSTAELDDIRKLRLYGNGGEVVPEDITSPRPNGLQEIPRHLVDLDANGRLDDGEYILFYGRSVRGWKYDASGRTFRHTVNPYTEKNSYFFTFDPSTNGRPLDSLTSASSGVPVTSVEERIANDQDRVNFVNSGRRWVGEPFDISDNTAVFTTLLPAILPNTPVRYRTVLFTRSSTIDTFRVYENDQMVVSPILMFLSDVSSVDQTGDYAYESPAWEFMHAGNLPEGRSRLKFVFGTKNQGAKGWLDWFEIFYRRALEARDDRLFFPSPDTSAVLEYTVRNLSSRNVVVWDVSDHSAVKRVTNIGFDVADASLCRFRLPQTAGSVRELAVVGATGFLSASAAKKVASPWLRTYTGRAQMVIITPPEFKEQAERLRQHRETNDTLSTLVVDIDAVYEEFGGGLPDPMAIRDFLAFARSRYAGPVGYVLFFGNGHFDYRNISTSTRNWIPPYETSESNRQIETYASDDFFAMLDPFNSRISLAIGRLPGRTVSEMRTLVDKIIRYETSAPLDPWRNRITFIADDGQTSTNPFEGNLHTLQAENLARFYTPGTFDQRKIYIVEYPTVISASGRRKPQANAAIIDAFNRGTLVMNFTGHGNTRLWTHEAIFTREASIPLLTNKDRLTFLVAATCNFAQWDNPNEQSGGEQLLTIEQGGAIGVVTATRSVYSFDNAELNYTLYSTLFTPDGQGRQRRVGDAFYAMKQTRYAMNDQKYHLLGDPAFRLARPQGVASIDSVNGVTTAAIAMVPSLGTAKVKGSLRRADQSVRTDFSGQGLLELFDSKRNVKVEEWGGYEFEVNGSALYRGEVSVSNGQFAASVPVPKDVTFGARARLAIYATSVRADAVGVTENLTIQGTDTTAAVDVEGPEITISFESPSFRSGDVVPPNPTLIVDLADQSGINTSTVGIGHRLEAEVFPDGRAVDLSDAYRGNLDTYQTGRATTTLNGMGEGKHRIKVRAWDVRNNSSLSEVEFEVRAGSDTDVYQVVNYPNPFSRSTTFTMQRASSSPVDVTIRIFTVAGRLIQELEAKSMTDRFVTVQWDGRDRDGDELANGVYLYKVIARTIDRSKSTELVGKLAVVR